MNIKLNRFLPYAASFLLPFGLVFIAYAFLRIAPFGDQTLLIADAQEMYISDLAYLKRFLLGQEGLFYTFEIAFGMPHIGQLTYMLNPSNFIVLFFELENFPTMYSLLTAINFSVCGLTMFILLSSVYGRSASNLIFSTIYALIGFNVANCFNYNFFVDVELLPLMTLGIVRIINGRAPWLYLVTLTFAIFSSFYFGFFLCVASVVLFLMFYFEKDESNPLKKKEIWFKYTASSIVAGLLPAFLWVPAFLSFLGGRAEQNSFSDFKLSETMSFAEAIAKLFTGANGPLEIIDGKPNIYCGTLVVFLVIFFFIDKRNPLRLKIIRAVPLVFYFTTFYVQALSMVMNGMTKTNWFNFRYSFVFSFLLIFIAFEQFKRIREPAKEDFKRACFVFAGMVLLAFSQKFNFIVGGNLVYDLLLFSICLAAILMTWGNETKSPYKLLIVRLLVLCSLQCVLNFTVCTKQLMPMSITQESYRKDVATGLKFKRTISGQRDGFVRAVEDPMPKRKLLASRIHGYNGTNYFGSAEQTFVYDGFGKLGMNWWRNRLWYPRGIPESFDSLLGIKYISSHSDLVKSKGYEKLYQIGKNSIYMNNNALPIAMIASDSIVRVRLMDNVFENHNNIWKSLTGGDKDVFIEEKNIFFRVNANHNGLNLNSKQIKEEHGLDRVRKENIRIDSGSESTALSREEINRDKYETIQLIVNNGRYIECTFVANHSGNIYSQVSMKDSIGGNVDRETTDAIRYLGRFRKGDRVTDYISIKNNANRDEIIKLCEGYRSAYVDENILSSYVAEVKSKSGTVELKNGRELTGSVLAEKKAELLFMIPYNSGWRIRIDGKDAKPHKSADLFISTNLEEGKHVFSLVYYPVGMKFGLMLSLSSLILLVILMAEKICFDRVLRKIVC